MSGHIRKFCQNSNGQAKTGRRRSTGDEAINKKMIKDDSGSGYIVIQSAWQG